MEKLSLQSPNLQVRKDDYESDRTYTGILNLARDIRKSFQTVSDAVNDLFKGPRLPNYTVSGVPSASENTRRLIYISDESGGAVPAFSDGTNWRRVTDRVIIS